MNIIQTVIADDHKLMRDGLRALLAGSQAVRVIGEAEDGRSAIHLAEELHPDVILMDVSMPKVDGIEATRRLTQAKHRMKVIGLSMHLDRRVIVDMIAAGAVGYLLKDCMIDEVAFALQSVMKNRMYFTPKAAELMLGDFARQAALDGPASPGVVADDDRHLMTLVAEGRDMTEVSTLLQSTPPVICDRLNRLIRDRVVPYFLQSTANGSAHPGTYLTARERQILNWMREGKSTNDMSSILGLSQDTVKYHLKKIYLKLNVCSRAQAIAVAMSNNLIDN